MKRGASLWSLVLDFYRKQDAYITLIYLVLFNTCLNATFFYTPSVNRKIKGVYVTKVKKGDKIKTHYTGKLENGDVFDSSEGRSPLEFEVGAGMMISGFDKGVLGMEVNETKIVTIPAEEAYGLANPELIIDIPKEQLPADLVPEIGMKLQAQADNGQVSTVTIVEIGDETMKLDANHELAGKTLIFDITLVEIA